MLNFIKYLLRSDKGTMLLGLIFFISPLSFNYSLNRLALSQSLDYKPEYTTFDNFTITRPGRRQSIILYEKNKEKETIQLSNRVSFSDVKPYKEYKGTAAYLEMEAGGAEPRRHLLEISFKGVNKQIGHTQDLPDKQERIASARRLIGFSVLLLMIGVLWVLYILYQYMSNEIPSMNKSNEEEHEKER